MATLDLTKAKFSFYMNDPDLVGFGANTGAGTPTAWGYVSTGNDGVLIKGQGMTFDAAGRPTAGTATSIAIDVGNDDPANPELVITGIDVPAASLDDGAGSFWRFLEGNDVILGPELAKGASGGTFTLFGDGIAGRTGATGGRDVIHVGDGFVQAAGDVTDVGSAVAGTPTADYHGGNDEILGLFSGQHQSVAGDAFAIYAGSRLTGGNDAIVMQTTYSGASAVGDAYNVVGAGGVLARVTGGNDYLSGAYAGSLYGDVYAMQPHALVQGGADTIEGGISSNVLVGDAYQMTTSRLVGGNDTINGNGGNDTIAGDSYLISADSVVVGGNDTIDGGAGNDTISGDVYSAYYTATNMTGGADVIRGGAGDDRIWGDSTDNNHNTVGVGGSDRLYGDDGNDQVYGQGGDDSLDGGAGADTLWAGDGNDWLSGGADNDQISGDAGDDQIDGGAGADAMYGQTGNDTYYVNSSGDAVTEQVDAGIDTVWSTLTGYTLGANVENLTFNGVGDFTGVGNALANVITGSAGADTLQGGDGDDALIGAAGADAIHGGNGTDTASYANAGGGVDARLTGNSINFGGDARGDTYTSIENLAGSAFDDNLLGDDAANTLAGGDGGDNLFGYGGADRLLGQLGDDRLLAKEGDDVLRGGLGADVLRGGAGNDVFDFDSVAESGPGARDIIAEDVAPSFEGAGVAGGDRIDLADIDANTSAGGNQAFVFGGTGIGRVSAVDAGTDTLIRCNIDKDAAFELELLIEDGSVLASAYKAFDFIL